MSTLGFQWLQRVSPPAFPGLAELEGRLRRLWHGHWWHLSQSCPAAGTGRKSHQSLHLWQDGDLPQGALLPAEGHLVTCKCWRNHDGTMMEPLVSEISRLGLYVFGSCSKMSCVDLQFYYVIVTGNLHLTGTAKGLKGHGRSKMSCTMSTSCLELLTTWKLGRSSADMLTIYDHPNQKASVNDLRPEEVLERSTLDSFAFFRPNENGIEILGSSSSYVHL